MKVRLLRDARIKHYAGEVVEVSPAEASFLTSVHSAVLFVETATAVPEAETAETKPAKTKRTKKG